MAQESEKFKTKTYISYDRISGKHGYIRKGTLKEEYDNYLEGFDNGKGICTVTGKPLKTFDEWLNPDNS
jgi:hypothetical protein|tara:strand:- start:76 stop:282 length:207 start_codon:yes stop_codon:yes gene_type:complete